MSYKTFRESVVRILLSQRLIRLSTKLTGDFYKEYWEEGLSPAQAVKEDLGVDAIHNALGLEPLI